MTLSVNKKNFETEVLQADIPVFVDFQATWCGPCKMMAPIVDQLAEEFEGRVKVVKLDIDESHEVAAQYKIKGVPTFILFNGGKSVHTWVGANSTKSIYTEKFNELLEKAD